MNIYINIKFITIFIIIIIAFNPKIKAQIELNSNVIQNYFKVKDFLLLDSNFDETQVIIKNYNNNLFYLGNYITEDKNKHYILGVSKDKKAKKEYPLVIKDYEWLKIINMYKIYDFAIYKDTLIITISKYLLFFVQNNEYFEFSKSIKLENQLHRIDTFEDYLVGFSSDPYVSFQGLSEVNTYYFVLDFLSNRSKFKILNNPKGLILNLLQPRYLINSFNNKIVVIDAVGDSILFSIYDCFQDKIINKFSYKPNTWFPPNYDDRINLEKKLNQDSLKYPKRIIDIIRPYLQKFSTISKIDFINDSTLLLYRSHPKSNYQDSYDLNYFFDIIKINNDSLKIIENLHNMNFNNETSLKYYRNSWHLRNSYILTGKYLLLIEPIPFEFDNSLFELSINQLREKIVNYCSQGSKIRYSIVILIYKDDE